MLLETATTFSLEVYRQSSFQVLCINGHDTSSVKHTPNVVGQQECELEVAVISFKATCGGSVMW